MHVIDKATGAEVDPQTGQALPAQQGAADGTGGSGSGTGSGATAADAGAAGAGTTGQHVPVQPAAADSGAAAAPQEQAPPAQA